MKEIEQYTLLLKKSNRKRVSLDTLYRILSNGDDKKLSYFRTHGYDHFYQIVKTLESRNILSTKSSKTNANPKPLHITYYIERDKKEHLLEQEKIFVYQLHEKIHKKSYLQDSSLLRSHKDLLKGIDYVLKNITNFEPSSLRERSYELFSQEKILEQSNILNRIKLKSEEILCIENPQPLLAYTLASFYQKKQRTILVIENLDTYWTFHRILNERKTFLNIDMLIFGKGYGVSDKKLAFQLYDITVNDHILYFGDLDAEGFRIYQLFKNKNPDYNISLCVDLYRELLKKGAKKGFEQLPNQNQPHLATLDHELKNFHSSERKKIKEIIENKLFVPQEALNRSLILKEGKRWKLIKY